MKRKYMKDGRLALLTRDGKFYVSTEVGKKRFYNRDGKFIFEK